MEDTGKRNKYLKAIFLVLVCLLAGSALMPSDYFLYSNNYEKAVEANLQDYNSRRISKSRYILNSAFIELFRDNLEDACSLFLLSGFAEDIADRKYAALAYFCRREKFIQLMDISEERDRVFPLYRAFYSMEKEQYEDALGMLRRLNINRLSNIEYQAYRMHYMKILLVLRDMEKIAGMIRSFDDMDLLYEIQDMEILRELSFFDIPPRREIIDRVLGYYYESRMAREGLDYLSKLYSKRIITGTSYRELRKAFLDMPLYIFINVDSPGENSEHLSLREGMEAYFQRQGRKISMENQDSRLVRYEITDRDEKRSPSRFYIPVKSLGTDESANIIQPFIGIRDKVRGLLEYWPDINSKKTLVLLQDWQQKHDILNMLEYPLIMAERAGHIPEHEKARIEYIIIDGTPEDIYLRMNDINWIKFESLKQIFLLNDLGGYASKLKGFRYRDMLSHLPVIARIEQAVQLHSLRHAGKHYYLGYDIAGIIDMIEKKAQNFSGVLADYYIKDSRLEKRINYEKLP